MHLVSKLQRIVANPAPYVHKAVKLLTFQNQLPLAWREFLGRIVPPFSGTSRFRAVYVVTYGRSGSTLLTSYLSTLPGFDIKGENNLFIMLGREAEVRLRASREMKSTKRDQHTDAWYGSHLYSVARWRQDQLRALLNQLYPQQLIPKTIGFKEIRWYGDAATQNLQASLDWLRELRQPSAIIFNTRNLDDVFKSGWWATKSPEELAEIRAKLKRFEATAALYVSENPQNAFITEYERLISEPEHAKALCAFLGVEFSESGWQKLLATPHSYPSKKK